MKRYTTAFAIAALLCTTSRVDANNDNEYSPPQPLREAVTSSSPATDINDDTVVAASKDKSAADVAESLRQDAPAPVETNDETNLAKSGADAATPTPTEENLAEIIGASDAATATTDSATQTATNVDPAPPPGPQIDEVEKENTGPALLRTRRFVYVDPIAEMMGGEFNTEVNQAMAESFLGMRNHVLRLKANRDL